MVLDGRGQRDVAQDSCFRRLALYAEESYVLVSVDPANGEAWFKLYGKQELKAPSAEHGHSVPLTHSLVKLRLF